MSLTFAGVELPPAAPTVLTDAAIVIFLHGRALGPDTVHQVAPAYPGARLVAPAGGVLLKRGSTWFENERIGVAKRDSVAAAETRFLAWLDGYVEAGCRPWLCGFSNGGAFAGHLLMHHPARFAGAALLSAPLVLPPWKPNVLRGKPVFYGRGRTDPVVPNDMFAAAEAYLNRASGAVLTRCHYDIAHEIDPAEVRDVAGWFARCTGTQSSSAPRPPGAEGSHLSNEQQAS